MENLYDYVKPYMLENNSGHVILELGTNEPINLPKQMNGIATFTMLLFADESHINESILFIDNSNSINPTNHLNNSKLNLNAKGASRLHVNFLNFIRNQFSF